jgi:hypothetical protein
MSKRTKTTNLEPLIPLQVKTRGEVREKMKLIAAKNGLSLNDVANMCLASGLGIVDRKLQEIHNPATDLQPA